VIQGATGLVFTTTSEGVNVAGAAGGERTPATGPAAKPKFPFMLRTTMPGPGGSTIEIYISPSELPPDVAEYIEAQKQKFIEQIRASMPTTAPAPVRQEAHSRLDNKARVRTGQSKAAKRTANRETVAGVGWQFFAAPLSHAAKVLHTAPAPSPRISGWACNLGSVLRAVLHAAHAGDPDISPCPVSFRVQRATAYRG